MISRAIARRLEILCGWLCGWDHDYGAYRHDPIDANLHELGHVLDAHGSLREAMRCRGPRPYDVNSVCFACRYPDANECSALAITFLVAPRLGHQVDEGAILADAGLSTGGTPTRKRVTTLMRSKRIQRIARELVADLKRSE